MTESDYSPLALRTWTAPLRGTPEGIMYLQLGLLSEIGEVSAVMKRILRDGTPLDVAQDRFDDELGDVLWYYAVLQWEHTQGVYDQIDHTGMDRWRFSAMIDTVCAAARRMGLDVGYGRSRARNITKLASRAERGVIQGSGDHR